MAGCPWGNILKGYCLASPPTQTPVHRYLSCSHTHPHSHSPPAPLTQALPAGVTSPQGRGAQGRVFIPRSKGEILTFQLLQWWFGRTRKTVSFWPLPFFHRSLRCFFSLSRFTGHTYTLHTPSRSLHRRSFPEVSIWRDWVKENEGKKRRDFNSTPSPPLSLCWLADGRTQVVANFQHWFFLYTPNWTIETCHNFTVVMYRTKSNSKNLHVFSIYLYFACSCIFGDVFIVLPY